MAELIYYDTDVHATANLYDILKAIPDFWDSYDDETSALTKGGITLTLGETKSISGYGKSCSISLGSNCSFIAATEKGILIGTTGGSSANAFAIGCNKDGSWAGTNGIVSGNYRVDNVVAEGVRTTTYNAGALTASHLMTQIVDLMAVDGNYIFEDIRRVLYAPATSYYGKLTMPNGEKYVKCGAYALRYTE
ncbi:hypothetical protein [Ruminococcus albus]|uniref:hypothetical protein n=1 Tax=Ruminococcus albus TaxID=1264 RepID=UPI00048EC4E5|nr:hypothetical protein [Ruminococcus albus]